MTGSVAPVFAVVVNWNGGEDNLACLDSLAGAGVEEERVVFVDNGSTDGSLDAVRGRFPRACLVENAANLGFGEGANRGARLALERGAAAVLFLNNDAVVEADTVGRITAALEADERLGVCGPRVLYRGEPPRVWCAGGMLTWRQNLSTLLGHRRPDGPEWRVVRDVDYVAGCAMLVRREVLEDVGLLEASYFAYMEDVEFCLRARRAGWRVATIGDVACVHEPSSATGGGYNPRRKYMQGVNSVHFLRTYGGLSEWLRFVAFDVATLPPLWVYHLIGGRHRAVLAKGLGVWDGLRGRRVTAERLQPGASALW